MTDKNYTDICIMFNCIMQGDGSVITLGNIQLLNDEALKLYEIANLNTDEIEELKKIIMICNVLYNRTDMYVLPIDDGFYDLLLEKYKNYDPNFQVGSAVVDMRNIIETNPDNPQKIAKCPITFADKEESKRDEIHQYVHDDIMRVGKNILTRNDFSRPAISFDKEYISKRTHNTHHNHPSLVGTLDKAKFVLNKDAIDAGVFNDRNVVVLERDFFQDHIQKGIISADQEISIVCELKYDGLSVEADCGLELESARSRGDTGLGEAQDMTPILKGYTFKNASCMIEGPPVGVKFEAIMTKTDLHKFNIIRNKKYANCRTAIIGLFGASDANQFRDLITLVPLAIDREQFPYFNNRLEEIEFLNKVFVSHGEPLRYCYFRGTVVEVLYMIKAFWDEAKLARKYLDFMYDGIVVSYVDEDIRNKLGRVNFINKYSMAVKFDAEERQTIFRGYTYEVGQHGNITPMLHYDPVEFFGTIHTKSTASSLNRFNELSLKYGDYINVTYVHDVMPYVTRLECDHNRNNTNPLIQIISECPVCGTKLIVSDSGKSLICPNRNCAGRSVKRMTNMFSKFNIKGFAEASFNILSDFDHLYKLYQVDRDFYISKLGDADGNAFANALSALKISPTKDFVLMGALGFTSISYKKWKQILSYIRLKDLNDLYKSCNGDVNKFDFELRRIIPNIGDVTCKTITSEWSFFEPDIDLIVKEFGYTDSYGYSKYKTVEIRFSGIRNKQLSEQLNTDGYDADDSGSVTKNTNILLIPYAGFTSSKVVKAQKNPATKIIPIQEFIENKDSILALFD